MTDEKEATTAEDCTGNPFEILLLSMCQLLTTQINQNTDDILTEEEFGRMYKQFDKLVPLYYMMLLQKWCQASNPRPEKEAATAETTNEVIIKPFLIDGGRFVVEVEKTNFKSVMFSIRGEVIPERIPDMLQMSEGFFKEVINVSRRLSTSQTDQQANNEQARELGELFVIIPDDESRTMTLYPAEEEQTAIKLTPKTAKVLIAILKHQLQKWL